jgi:hypothetical protein
MSFELTSPRTRNTHSSQTRGQPKESLLVEVRRSPIQGRGVFTRAAVAKGTRLLEYTGARVNAEDVEEDLDDETSRRHHTFLFSINEKVLIDGLRGGNESRFINHSCDPNCWAVLERGRIFIEARRELAAGEELAYDYWYTTDASYTEADLRRIYPCKCGAKRCRGTLAAPRPAPAKTRRRTG